MRVIHRNVQGKSRQPARDARVDAPRNAPMFSGLHKCIIIALTAMASWIVIGIVALLAWFALSD